MFFWKAGKMALQQSGLIMRAILCRKSLPFFLGEASPALIHSSSSHLAQPRRKPVPVDIEGYLKLQPQGPADEKKFGDLVYSGVLSTNLRMTKSISSASSITGFLAQPYLVPEIGKMPAIGAIMFSMFAGFFVYITPFLLHRLTRSYVLRLYYDRTKDEFTAVTFRLLPIRLFTTFRRQDVRIPRSASALSVITVMPKEGGRPRALFVNGPDFYDQDAYVKLMGYDKPIQLNEEEVD